MVKDQVFQIRSFEDQSAGVLHLLNGNLDLAGQVGAQLITDLVGDRSVRHV